MFETNSKQKLHSQIRTYLFIKESRGHEIRCLQNVLYFYLRKFDNILK